MKVLYIWLTMGSYHVARMQAIQEEIGQGLSVLEVTNRDDHEWSIDKSELINYTCLQNGRLLSKEVIYESKSLLKNYLAQHNFDLIVNGAGYAHKSIQKVLQKQGGDAKLILWSETTASDNPSNPIKKFVKKRRVAAYDGAIVAGRRHKDYLIELGMPSHKIQIVGNVVNNTRFTPVDWSKEQRNLGFLYVGRLLDIKNVDMLINSYALYVDQEPNGNVLPLTIVGDGPEMNTLKKLTGKLNISSIHFEGNVQPSRIPQKYSKAEAFILPSYSEPWGLVTNEAMASGLPVLISQNCGSAELIEHEKNGIIFNPNNKEALASWMQKVSQNRDWSKMLGDNALRTIRNYSPESYARKCIDFFHNQII